MDTQEVGKRLGVGSVTLRLWERKGLIGPIRKDARGWRIWDDKDVAECKRLMTKLHGGNSKTAALR